MLRQYTTVSTQLTFYIVTSDWVLTAKSIHKQNDN